MKNLESFDSGSYMCVCELTGSGTTVNASSETTLMVMSAQNSGGDNNNKYKLVKSFNQKSNGGRKSSGDSFNEDYFLSASSDSLNGRSSSSSSSTLDDDDDDTDSDLFNDEFPSLNPTIVEQFDDKGFCEPYKGTVCAGKYLINFFFILFGKLK